MSKKIYSVKTADLAGLDLELATETHDGKKVFKLKSGTLPESIKKIELVTPTVPIERKQTRSLFGIGSAKPPETGSIPAVTAVISDDQILAASKESTEVQIERIKTKIQAYSCTPVEGKSSPTLAPCKKDSLTDDLINYVGTNMLGTGLVFDSYSISSEEIVGEVSVSKENNLFWLHKVLILEPKFLGTTTIKLDRNQEEFKINYKSENFNHGYSRSTLAAWEREYIDLITTERWKQFLSNVKKINFYQLYQIFLKADDLIKEQILRLASVTEDALKKATVPTSPDGSWDTLVQKLTQSVPSSTTSSPSGTLAAASPSSVSHPLASSLTEGKIDQIVAKIKPFICHQLSGFQNCYEDQGLRRLESYIGGVSGYFDDGFDDISLGLVGPSPSESKISTKENLYWIWRLITLYGDGGAKAQKDYLETKIHKSILQNMISKIEKDVDYKIKVTVKVPAWMGLSQRDKAFVCFYPKKEWEELEKEYNAIMDPKPDAGGKGRKKRNKNTKKKLFGEKVLSKRAYRL